jgi:predicted CXXCH cytochrome family protein
VSGKRGLGAAVGLMALVAAAAGVRAEQVPPGICARCHQDEAALAAIPGGHLEVLACVDCHEDRRPGRFGRHHRTIPSCTSHHEEAGHPPRAAKRARKHPTSNCVLCHDPHGSTNLDLVRTGIRATRRRLAPIELTTEDGAAPGGFTHPADPGTGVCETCHRRTDFYRANGRGKPHFTESCILCHEHDQQFRPVVAEKNCTICHPGEGARFAKASQHSARFQCVDCHAEVSPTPGPGHRAVPACAECHDNVTHAPPGDTPFACTTCHDPHGTDNIDLVLDTITTPQGAARAIVFDNLLGQVDGSFASASAPGTGICEICHTQTRFYRADGTGEPHFTFSCLPCHLHSRGFNPG